MKNFFTLTGFLMMLLSKVLLPLREKEPLDAPSKTVGRGKNGVTEKCTSTESEFRP